VLEEYYKNEYAVALPKGGSLMISHIGRLLFALMIVLFPATLGAVPAATQGNLDGFDAFMANAMENFKVPGAAVVVVKDDKVLLMKGYGYRDTAK
jgi:CubicO group peptidase (beta-lactamase class C family)